MNQRDLQRLAAERIEDAKVLLAADRWSLAYYVSGYAVECALKSCVLSRLVHTGWIFSEDVKKIDFRTHSLDDLVKFAGLYDLLNERLKAGGDFPVNWAIAVAWKVTSRYETKSQDEAKELFHAITEPGEGVLEWIMNYW